MTSLSGDFLGSHLIKSGNARIIPKTSVDKFADVLEGFNYCFGSSNQGGQVDLLLQHVPCNTRRIIENYVCTIIPADICLICPVGMTLPASRMRQEKQHPQSAE